jgi:hypothetical protein
MPWFDRHSLMVDPPIVCATAGDAPGQHLLHMPTLPRTFPSGCPSQFHLLRRRRGRWDPDVRTPRGKPEPERQGNPDRARKVSPTWLTAYPTSAWFRMRRGRKTTIRGRPPSRVCHG